MNGVRDLVSCGRGRDLASIDLLDRVARDCEIVTRQISRDPYKNPASQHQTEVEPDSFAVGSTVVAVFQVGRIFSGGSANIGFAVSRNRGRTWTHGFLPGLVHGDLRATDPAIAYDASLGMWLAVSMVFDASGFSFAVNRSADGRHWSRPTTVTETSTSLDKQWIACDNWAQSPFRGRCYLSYSDVTAGEVATQVTADGGRTWSAPVSGPGSPGRSSIAGAYAPGVQPVVLPDGTALIPYFDTKQISVLRSTDGGASWSAPTPVAPASYIPHAGFRAAPLPSAEVGADGKVYVAWADCSLRASCAANDIVFTSSADGVTWSTRTRIPTGPGDAELPGLAVDPARRGYLALAYYVLRRRRLDVRLVSSTNGGLRWSTPEQLDSRSFPLSWIARTSQGSMVGDYISTSLAGGRAVPVFALATRPRRGTLHESIFATSLAVPR